MAAYIGFVKGMDALIVRLRERARRQEPKHQQESGRQFHERDRSKLSHSNLNTSRERTKWPDFTRLYAGILGLHAVHI